MMGARLSDAEQEKQKNQGPEEDDNESDAGPSARKARLTIGLAHFAFISAAHGLIAGWTGKGPGGPSTQRYRPQARGMYEYHTANGTYQRTGKSPYWTW
jgi:hypothetical protein